MASLATGSLKGLTIAFAGAPGKSHEQFNKPVAELQRLLANHNGVFQSRLTSDTTHLCANPDQVAKRIVKVKEAENYPGIKVVDFNWLSTSLQFKTPVDDTPFLLVQDITAKPQNTTIQTSAVGKKRARNLNDDNDNDENPGTILDVAPPPKKAKEKETQIARSLSLKVPLDKGCNPQYKVHIGEDGTIYDATLNQTNSGDNHNKFYRIQLLDDRQGHFRTWTRWGRVNEDGQSKLLGDGSYGSALMEFEKKFKDKNGNPWGHRNNPVKSGKYTLLELSYEDSSDEEDDMVPGPASHHGSKESIESAQQETVESKLPGPVQKLMKLIFNEQYFNDTMATFDYDADKMPLGKLSKRTLLKGYEMLKELATLVADTSRSPVNGEPWIDLVKDRSNNYFSLIPHAFGRKKPPVLGDLASIKKEIDLLEVLTDMQLADNIMKDAKRKKDEVAEQMNLMDRQYQGLGMQEMTPIAPASQEFNELSTYLVQSAGVTHGINYQIQDIFRIERQGENDRFAKSMCSKVKSSDRRLLWHGSRCTNFGGILSQGLRIAPPEAPVSGYMFGKGIYLADMSTKSANYCAAATSDGVGLLLLCEAELGKPSLKLINADSGAGERAKKENYLSTWGVGRTAPKGWKDAGCVNDGLKGVLIPDLSVQPGDSGEQAFLLYNEYIVYDVAQIRLRYLFRVEMKSGW